MAIYFIVGYVVIALSCVGLGLYLSYPGHTLLTLKDAALSAFPRRSRPASVDQVANAEPKRPSFFEELSLHEENTLYHVATPPQTPVSDASHEEPSLAAKIVALGEAIKSSSPSDASHEEAEPAEAVHDEP